MGFVGRREDFGNHYHTSHFTLHDLFWVRQCSSVIDTVSRMLCAPWLVRRFLNLIFLWLWSAEKPC
jgi:hypothetical protein